MTFRLSADSADCLFKKQIFQQNTNNTDKAKNKKAFAQASWFPSMHVLRCALRQGILSKKQMPGMNSVAIPEKVSTFLDTKCKVGSTSFLGSLFSASIVVVFWIDNGGREERPWERGWGRMKLYSKSIWRSCECDRVIVWSCGSRLKGMPQKDLINIRNYDVRHLIPKVCSAVLKMAPKYW